MSKGFGNSVRTKGGLEKHIIKESGGQKKSKEWYRRQVFEYLYDNMTDEVEPEKLYYYEYDPKYKAQMDRYDIYPLVYSLDRGKDDFLGSNIHYLRDREKGPYALALLNKKARIIEKTIHRYIFKQADHLFFEVKDEDWEFIASLPIHKFIEN